MALCFLVLYFFSITGLSYSGVLTLADHSGEHQVSVKDHRVILHHSGTVARGQHATPCGGPLLIQESPEQDHVIGFSDDLAVMLEQRELIALLDDSASDACSEIRLFTLGKNCADAMASFCATDLADRENQFLACWRCLRLNV